MKYAEGAVERAKDGAAEWLKGDPDGYPRSWQQEEKNEQRRGYALYDDFEAPPIVGYEALEREGLVVRRETVFKDGQERVHFRINPPPD
jgi:hypothetical protein